MDASKITQLLQKQNTRYINRSTTVDSSTLIWQNQIKSSKYIEKTPNCVEDVDDTHQNACVTFPTETCCSDGNGIVNYGGQGKNITLMTGSPQQFPNPYYGAKGSGAFVYSSEALMLQKAGKQACIKSDAKYTVLPACFCINSNGPTTTQEEIPINNNVTNPYLPQFDTFLEMKTPKCVPCVEVPHFVRKCGKCTLEPDTKLVMAPCTCAQSLSGYVSEEHYPAPVIPDPITEGDGLVDPDLTGGQLLPIIPHTFGNYLPGDEGNVQITNIAQFPFVGDQFNFRFFGIDYSGPINNGKSKIYWNGNNIIMFGQYDGNGAFTDSTFNLPDGASINNNIPHIRIGWADRHTEELYAFNVKLINGYRILKFTVKLRNNWQIADDLAQIDIRLIENRISQKQYVEVRIQQLTNVRPNEGFLLSNGTQLIDVLNGYQFPSIIDNMSYVLESDINGFNWQFIPNSTVNMTI